ncbi:MAG: hypothetical protein AAFO72_03050 [Pseudomonadota bacterium]
MKYNHFKPGRVNPHLPHDGIEIEPSPTDTDVAQREADLLVSQLMKDSTKPGASSQKDKKSYPQEVVATAEAITVDASVTDAPAVDTTMIDATLVAPKMAPKMAVELRDGADVTRDLRASFPKLSDETLSLENQGRPGFFTKLFKHVPPAYLAVGFGVAAAILAPKLLAWTVIAAVVVVVITLAMLKAPGLSTLSLWAWRRFADRDPDRAEQVRKVADSTALSVEYMLDRLPGSLADRFALPDFSQPVPRKR